LDEVTKLIAAGKPKSLDSAANSAAGCNQIAVLTLLLDKGASPAEALKRAVATGAMESMRYLVAHGVDIQKVGYDNLCRAARHGQTGSTAFLLGLKVSPNREKQPGDTSLTEIDPPLNQAAGAGAVGVVKLLLDAGADPNSVVVGDPRMGDTGNTPIDEACGGDHDDILRLLLDHGARLDLMTQRGFTPALFAAYVHAPRCLALLIDRGVDTKAFNSQWKSGIDGFGAIFTGEDANRPDLQRFETTSQIQRGMDTMQVLLDKGILNVNSTGGEGFSLLSIAIVNGQTAWTEMLLNHGANVNTVDDYGGTPLIRAITSMATVKEQRYYAVLDELLARGADPNLGIDNPIVKQDAVPSALKAAICGSGKMDMIRRTVNSLLAHGARFSVPKGSDADKMLLAATAGDADAVGKLLAKGASPNIADSKGWTPLLSAAALHNDAVLKLLVDAGADVNAHDVLGLNAQWFAICRYPDLGEFHLVLDKGADVNADSGYLYYQPDIYLAIMQHDPVLLGELLKRGASPNMLPGDHPERFEPLELAVDQLMENFGDQKRRDVVTMLIAAGANRNPRPAGREGTSLLFYPVSNDMTDMVKFLLAAGVDPKKDQDGGKALSEELARYGSPEMKSLLAGDLPRL
jgi:ankyrin repeat protein